MGSAPRDLLRSVPALFSHPLVLLLAGAFASGIVIPEIQAKAEERKLRSDRIAQCLLDVQTYRNSIWEEYYIAFPVAPLEQVSDAVYTDALRRITTLKVKRYEAFNRLLFALKMRAAGRDGVALRGVVGALDAYAKKINGLSADVLRWLKSRWCSECVESPPKLIEIREELLRTEQQVDDISERLVDEIAKEE